VQIGINLPPGQGHERSTSAGQEVRGLGHRRLKYVWIIIIIIKNVKIRVTLS